MSVIHRECGREVLWVGANALELDENGNPTNASHDCRVDCDQEDCRGSQRCVIDACVCYCHFDAQTRALYDNLRANVCAQHGVAGFCQRCDDDS